MRTPESGSSLYLESMFIRTDNGIDFDDWKDDLQSEYPELSENELIEKMYEINADYLDDERVNLNRQLSQSILIIGDLGLWNGRSNGYKMIDSGNLKDCLYTNSDMAEWYVDKRGDLRCDAVHHDGTNHYLYRVFKDGVSETQIENLQNKIYFGKATRADITRVTRRLGDEINKVYNIDLPFVREKQPREIER